MTWDTTLTDDTKAFEAFFNKHHEHLVGYVMSLTNDTDTAEDIAQQAFITLWNRRGSLMGSTNLKGYLFKTAKNLFVDHYRNQQSRAHVYAELTTEALSEQLDEDPNYLQARIKLLRSIISTLPDKCQEVLRLTKIEGLKYQEVADILGISVKTVDAQLQRAYKRIKEGFEKNGPINLFISFIRTFRTG